MFLPAVAGALLAACSGGAMRSVVPASGQLGNANAGFPAVAGAANVIHSCGTVNVPGYMRCFAVFRTDLGNDVMRVRPGYVPSGYGPAQLQSAYQLPSTTAGSGQTVAVVDAYDDPNAAQDLAVYRSTYNLPACGTGCFSKVNQRGGTAYPRRNAGWAQEESLDLDMVSAICPNCKIVLVEATSPSTRNLNIAVNEAVALGANVVSNSYGGNEVNAVDKAYVHPGHIITASAGDSGYGAQQPCSYASVVCVGGTSLRTASNARGWSETAWSGSGSGCSRYVAKPSWQTDKGCRKRSESDVSAVADPNTGVAVYDSLPYSGYSGWMVFGGTSASSPIVAATYALAGNASSMTYASSIWAAGISSAHASSLTDVTSGGNGSCPVAYRYICKAGVGYDGPTGWGTPLGTAAF